MKPSYGSFMLTLVLVAGCAALTGPPPSPPLAIPARDAPKEFNWSPFQWKPGRVLTYDVHSFAESNRMGKESSQFTMRFEGIDRTVKGLTRVRVLADNIEFGVFLVDDLGKIHDASASRPDVEKMFEALTEGLQSPMLEQMSRPRTVGEVFDVDFSTAKMRGLMPLDWGSSLAPSITARYEFLGYVWLAETLGAAFKCDIPNMLGSPIRARDRNNTEFQIDSLSGTMVEYYDPVDGYLLSKYEVGTAAGIHGGKPLAFRTITLTTLDRKQSRGLQSQATSLAPQPQSPEMRYKKVYELTREELPTGEGLRGANLSVFGVRLGSSYAELLSAVSAVGRPFREEDVSRPPMKAVAVFFGEEEVAGKNAMLVFHAKDGHVRQIFLYGSPHVMSGTGTPPFRGFDAFVVGNTKTLLDKCNEQDRWRILGREDRQAQKEFPAMEWRYTVYEYDKPAIVVTHSVGKLKPTDPISVEYCVLRLGESMLTERGGQ